MQALNKQFRSLHRSPKLTCESTPEGGAAPASQRLKGLRRMERILESSQLGTWEWNIPTGQAVFNEQWAQCLGYSLAELAPVSIKTWEGLCHPEELKQSNRLLERHFAGETPYYDFECRMKHKDGRWLWVHDRGRVLLRAPDGKPLVMVGTRADNTERKRLAALSYQDQKMESLRILAGEVADQMNDLLCVILALASAHVEILPSDSSVQPALETIVQACDKGRELTWSLGAFARQCFLEEADVDLNRLVQQCVQSLRDPSLPGRVRTELDLAPALQPIVGDLCALASLLDDLVTNALEAMPGPGILSIRTRNTVTGWVEAQVEDTGTGMSEEISGKALTPLFTTKGKGLGMGLPMAYATVRSHHGQMEIQSEPDQGTCVSLRFPTSIPRGRVAENGAGPAEKADNLSLKIMVVDDDVVLQQVMSRTLKMLGHSSEHALNGEEALAKLEAGYEPDAVILDMNMPVMGGAMTLPRLRALRPSLPILISTGLIDQAAMDLAATHANVTLVPKPMSVKDLRRYLATLRLAC